MGAGGLRLLVLGGTVFLGRHLVEAALARDHEVTLFNRGLTAPELFPDVEQLRGDRDGGLGALAGRRWEAVVDPSGFVPRLVRASAAALADAVELYVFVSTASVYPAESADRSEAGPVIELADPGSEDVTAHYGGLKALCERAAEAVLPGRVLNVRSGLIVGPEDPTGRFTYWPLRLARGGEVLAPGDPERPVQFVDGRDEAAWILDMAERRRAGLFNLTGPGAPMREVLEGVAAAVESEAGLTWVSDDFLLERGVQPYTELPLWLPASDRTLDMPVDRALAAGLRIRPLAETARDTLAWARAHPEPRRVVDAGGRLRTPSGLRPEREAELLRAWHERAGGQAAGSPSL